MENNSIPRLCGGTFFTLLLQARKQRTSARAKTQGETDGLSDSDILQALIKIADPNFQSVTSSTRDSFRTVTSKYKTCMVSSSTYLPFTESGFADYFDSRVKNNYEDAFKDMVSFSNTYLNATRRGNWLAAALLELISEDDSIDGNENFYISREGFFISKNDFNKLGDISLEALLLGVWHYVVTQRKDNSIGHSTYESWHRKSAKGNSRWEFVSDIGNNFEQSLSVSFASAETKKLFIDDPKNLFIELKEPVFRPHGRKILMSPYGEFDVYMQNARNKYSSLKTLLYSDQPRPFYSFYVCNDIYQYVRVSNNRYTKKVLSNATVSSLLAYSNFVIISGNGGLGKSMMMRHLLLDAIKNYNEYNRLPIFVPLKDYGSYSGSVLEYVYGKFTDLGADVEINEFEDLLSEGKCLLLFDGLDEIHSLHRMRFETELESFANRYSKNMFVISSRPYTNFLSFDRFTVLQLSPFNKKQALELIDKLDFRPDEPAIKAAFRKQLDETLYYTHTGFTDNPLLLTIMLMTFEQFAEIPSKMHIFYHEAYLALSQKHDASKGAYKRSLCTNLTADRFSDYFAEFCARSYRDEKFELTETEFENYFYNLNYRKRDHNTSTAADFIEDLTTNMCLMYYESQKYHFIHRSFQEYFCALYFSKQKDRTLWDIGQFFENKRGRNYGDATFDMLYSMIPENIEEYIFLPYLTNLITKCDNERGYWTFLMEIYPEITYYDGEVMDKSRTSPASFLFDFIASKKRLWAFTEDTELPFYEDFVAAEYAYLDENWRDEDGEPVEDLVDIDEVDSEYIDEFGQPDRVGCRLEFEISEVLDRFDDYEKLLKALNDDDYPLKEQYLEVRQLLQELQDEYMDKQPAEGKDLFDLF